MRAVWVIGTAVITAPLSCQQPQQQMWRQSSTAGVMSQPHMTYLVYQLHTSDTWRHLYFNFRITQTHIQWHDEMSQMGHSHQYYDLQT